MRISGITTNFDSGAGEHIVRAALARAIGEAFMISENTDPHDILYHILIEKFWSKHVYLD